MIALLLIWTVLIPGVLAVGVCIARATGWPENLKEPEDRFAAAAWTGLLASGSILLAVAAFAPVKPWMVAALFAPLMNRNVRSDWGGIISRRSVFPVVAGLAPAFAFSLSGAERVYDAGLYHNQLVRWIADEGIVPGLALIHFRFSFSSSWFALGALFDLSPWESRLSRSINGIALLLLYYHFVIALSRACRRQASPRDWYLLIGSPLLLAFTQLEALNVSTSPNLGAAAALFFGGWLLLEGPSALALVVAGGAFAVKLTVAPLALAALGKFRWRIFLYSAALAAPLLLANFRASGCPMFPSSLFCAETAAGLGKEGVKRAMADSQNRTSRSGRNVHEQKSDPGWIARWTHHTWSLTFLFPIILALAAHLLYRRWTRTSTFALMGVGYFVFVASDYRFGIGYIAALCGTAAAITITRVPLPKLSRTALTGLVASGTIFVALVSEHLGYQRTADPRLTFDPARFVVPSAGFRHPGPAMTQIVNEVKIWRAPKDNRCGTLRIPCTPYPPDPTLHLCDPTRGFSGGFCRKVP